MVLLAKKHDLYLKKLGEAIKENMSLIIELQKTGSLSPESILCKNKIDDNLKKYKEKCFSVSPVKEIDFCRKQYLAGQYNKRFIVSVSGIYFNIWRKTGNGFFLLPIQYPRDIFVDNMYSNTYLLDISFMKDGRYYDVHGNEDFECFIDDSFKENRKTLGGMQKALNIELDGIPTILGFNNQFQVYNHH